MLGSELTAAAPVDEEVMTTGPELVVGMAGWSVVRMSVSAIEAECELSVARFCRSFPESVVALELSGSGWPSFCSGFISSAWRVDCGAVLVVVPVVLGRGCAGATSAEAMGAGAGA
jgi:hypothetical protein